MAVDVQLSIGTADGAVIATDQIATKHYQIVKVTFGALDSQTIASSGAGNADAGTQRVVIASDQAALDVSAATLTVNSHAVTNAGTFAVQSTLQAGTAEIGKLAAGVAEIGNIKNSGTFATQATLQAGTATFGKLAANSGVDIGDVDVTSIIPGVGATNLGKAEDAAHSSGDVGVMALGVRTDSPTAVSADGDYHPSLFSEEGGLWTEHVPNEIDSGNSSTSTLTSASVFTGTGIDLLKHDGVTVNIDASHDSATDGMQFQFSSDNSNWDLSFDFNYMAANGGRTFQFGVYARFFRVVYTNGGTNQTHFRLQTILAHNVTLTTIHRLVDDANPDRSAQIVKAAIIAQAAGSGDFKPVQSTAGGNLKVAVEEFDTALPAGANLIGDVGIGVRTSGGIPIDSVYYDNDLDEAPIAAKAAAGQIYFIHAMNTTAAPLYLQIFNVAQGSVTVETTVPDMQFIIPGNADSDGAGFTINLAAPIDFDVAITVACSTDNEGNGAPGANACHVNIGIN